MSAAGFVGDIPDNYDRGLGPVIFADYALDIAGRVAAGAPRRVLETAAGTGIVTRCLRDALPAATELVATDLNPPMLAHAQAKFRPGERVRFEPADATALPFPDASFDAVACQFGVMFFPDKDKSYCEAHRVLGPGGRYVFSVWDAIERNPFGRIAHETVCALFPADPPGFYLVPFGYHKLDPVKDAVLAAGFRSFAATVVRIEKEVAKAASFARGLVYGNPLIDQIRQRGGVDPERAVEAIRAAFERAFGPDPIRIPLQTIVFETQRA